MLTYILRRLLWAIPTIVALSFLTFVVMHLTPGGPFDAMRAKNDRPIPDSVMQALKVKYGLDRPWWEQYARYMWNALHGDLGPSFAQDISVSQIIAQGLPVSASLGGLALGLGLVAGAVLGIASALRRNTVIDYVAVLISMVGVSVPAFVLALYFISLFSVRLHLLPTGGWGQPRHYVLPALVLALGPASSIARYLRSSILEVQGQDFVRTARAKGLAPGRILTAHVLRNALIPVATVVGLTIPNLLTGSFIVESLFRIPGIGGLFVNAVGNRDYTAIMGSTLLYALVAIVVNLLTDILYAGADPRIRYS